jgi:hypothetical protein
MKSKTLPIITVLVSIALALTVDTMQHPRTVKAQDQLPQLSERLSFGMVAITSGQTLRVSVANTIMSNDDQLPVGPSRVVINFRYPNGNLVRDYRTSEVIRRVVDLERGTGAFVDVDYDQLPPSPVRVQMRPVIVVTPPDGTAGENTIPIDSVVPTVEVINNANGRTQFALFTHPAAARGFNPQPDPPRQ